MGTMSEREKVGTLLPKGLYAAYRDWAKERRTQVSYLIEEAMTAYLKRRKK